MVTSSQTLNKVSLFVSAILALLLVILFVAGPPNFLKSFQVFNNWEIKEPVWLDTNAPNVNWDSPFGWILNYVFGIDSVKAQTVSALIVLLAVWAIFFLAFGDTIEQYGFFGKGIGWIIGFAMAVILANLNMYYSLLVNLMSFFSFMAAASVIFALLSIFAAMLVVNLGIGGAGAWLYRRRLYSEAAKSKADIEASGKTISSVLTALGELGSGFKKANRRSRSGSP